MGRCFDFYAPPQHWRELVGGGGIPGALWSGVRAPSGPARGSDESRAPARDEAEPDDCGAQSTVRVHWIETQRCGLTKERYKGAPLQPLTLASEWATGGLMRRIP
ncbi:hypothetical protein NDU88_002845 [Pleurodeles waltl]|uniref:Uncharacterized protein n=1 Tax=Pleurodeles waltl TaxID=8319 RepID=A0AAV7VFR7_PLEWA|nr:hypothetical protein NDU88_002845 [Pleurodeles waltl]